MFIYAHYKQQIRAAPAVSSDKLSFHYQVHGLHNDIK